MRILIASFVPLRSEQGSTQTAMELGETLRTRGHEVVYWSPPTRPRWLPWWQDWRWKRRRLVEFVRAQRGFDIIDVPPIAACAALRSGGILIARSVQPDIEYMRLSRTLAPTRSRMSAALQLWHERGAIRDLHAGWRAADLILCLGSAEKRRMAEDFPLLSHKLAHYEIAPPEAERSAFQRIAAGRRAATSPTRWLWIGRWTPHKGTQALCRFLTDRLAGHTDDRFTLAGCGPVDGELPDNLLRTGRLVVVPSFKRSQLPELLASHNAGLFTSVVEGWGLTLQEMLESGLPVYATVAGAVDDLRAYFPTQLRAFPPAPGRPADGQDDPTRKGYFERFSWPSIGIAYEKLAMGNAARQLGRRSR